MLCRLNIPVYCFVDKAVAEQHTIDTLTKKYSLVAGEMETLAKKTVPELQACLKQKDLDIQNKNSNFYKFNNLGC